MSICSTLSTEGLCTEVAAEFHRSKREIFLKKKVKNAKQTVNFLLGFVGLYFFALR